MADYIIALDQGTTSSRAIIFDKKGRSSPSARRSTSRSCRAPAGSSTTLEIRDNMREVIGIALGRANLTRHDIAAVGITNQRETAVVWDKNTGIPVYNAIVWQDTRTQPIVDRLAATAASSGTRTSSACRWRPTSRAPRSSGSSRTSRGAREGRSRRPDLRHDRHVGALEPHRRPDGGVHATDVTNASRTLFMDLRRSVARRHPRDFGVPRR
jgi:glycerol kinase